MNAPTYLNFDLRIEPWEDGYRARVVESPVDRGATALFALSAQDAHPQEWAGTQGIQAFGGRLFRAVFDGDVYSHLRRSQDEAERLGAVGLRIRLLLTDVPELAALPWEYLYDPGSDQFLALSIKTPIVRYLDLPQRVQPLAVSPPLRVLVLISSPHDEPALDVEREWQNLNAALAGLQENNLVVLDRLEKATLPALQVRLRRETYHVFHYIGHGGFEERSQDGMLVLEDPDGLGQRVSGRVLGTLLHDETSLRLVILNACQGARGSSQNPFAGTAQSLVRKGLPAVLAMQSAISDEAAKTYAHEFYRAVADDYPVDAALTEARKALYLGGNEREWGTPVLYMRAPEGRIFDLSTTRWPIAPTPVFSPPPRDGQPVTAKPAPERRATRPAADLSPYEREVEGIHRQLQRRRTVLFVGADLPEQITGLPGRKALADTLAAQEGIAPGRTLAQVAQEVMGYQSRWGITDFLQGALDTVEKSPRPFHQAIVALVRAYGLETIVTTAYDDLLEMAFRQTGLGLDLVVRDDDLRFARSDCMLIRLYGHWRQADTLVITEQDQNTLLRGRIKRDLVDTIRFAFRRSSILFLGHDLGDPAVSALFDELVESESQIPSFAVWSGMSEREQEFFESKRNLTILDVDPVALVQSLVERAG